MRLVRNPADQAACASPIQNSAWSSWPSAIYVPPTGPYPNGLEALISRIARKLRRAASKFPRALKARPAAYRKLSVRGWVPRRIGQFRFVSGRRRKPGGSQQYDQEQGQQDQDAGSQLVESGEPFHLKAGAAPRHSVAV